MVKGMYSKANASERTQQETPGRDAMEINIFF